MLCGIHPFADAKPLSNSSKYLTGSATSDPILRIWIWTLRGSSSQRFLCWNRETKVESYTKFLPRSGDIRVPRSFPERTRQEESATTKRYVEELRVASEEALMEAAEWDPGDSLMLHEGLIGKRHVVNNTWPERAVSIFGTDTQQELQCQSLSRQGFESLEDAAAQKFG